MEGGLECSSPRIGFMRIGDSVHCFRIGWMNEWLDDRLLRSRGLENVQNTPMVEIRTINFPTDRAVVS